MNQYGCSNATRKNGYYASQRINSDNGRWHYHQIFIKDTSSKECRYDMRRSDAGCSECLSSLAQAGAVSR